jgi:hypothetical protein
MPWRMRVDDDDDDDVMLMLTIVMSCSGSYCTDSKTRPFESQSGLTSMYRFNAARASSSESCSFC